MAEKKKNEDLYTMSNWRDDINDIVANMNIVREQIRKLEHNSEVIMGDLVFEEGCPADDRLRENLIATLYEHLEYYVHLAFLRLTHIDTEKSYIASIEEDL